MPLTEAWTLMTGLAPIRKQLGLTQQQLGDALGAAQTTVRRWENGWCLPDIPTLFALCDCLTTYAHAHARDLTVAPVDLMPALKNPGRIA